MAKLAHDFSTSLAGAVRAAAPSVVGLSGARQRATGTVWDDGIIVTSAAAIDADDVEVHGDGDQAWTAQLLGRDLGTDLAVYAIPDGGPPAIARHTADDLEVGNLVLALGRPGVSVRASLRIVGALARDVVTPLGGRLERYIETDRALPRRFAGGPLVDPEGALVGIGSRSLVRGADLAIPVETVARVVDEIRTSGSVRRGFLGVGAYPVRLPDALAQARQQRRGAIVVALVDGGPADAAGVLIGDIVVDIGGHAVRGPRDVRVAVAERAGESVDVALVRAGAVQTVTVTLGARS